MSHFEEPFFDREITIEEKIRREEDRIREINRRINEYANLCFSHLKDYHKLENIYDKEDPHVQKLLKTIDDLASVFPFDLIEDIDDIKYIVSQCLVFFGTHRDGRTDPNDIKVNFNEVIIGVIFDICRNKDVDESDVIQDFLDFLDERYPVFFRQDTKRLRYIRIYESSQLQLPSEFFKNPTQFIEGLEFIERNIQEFAHNAGSLLDSPYDFTRVRKYRGLVFKRVDISKVRYGTEEIDEATKISDMLKSLNDDRIKVQNFLGFVYDQGNLYLVSEFIRGKNIHDIKIGSKGDLFSDSEGDILKEKIVAFLKSVHIDIADRNIILELKEGKDYNDSDSVKTITIIDFETKH